MHVKTLSKWNVFIFDTNRELRNSHYHGYPCIAASHISGQVKTEKLNIKY